VPGVVRPCLRPGGWFYGFSRCWRGSPASEASYRLPRERTARKAIQIHSANMTDGCRMPAVTRPS